MIFRSTAVLILFLFYGIYFYKQKKYASFNKELNSIFKNNSKNHNKPDKQDNYNIMLKLSCILLFIIQLISIYRGNSYFGIMTRIIGIYLGVTGNIILFLSVIYLKKTNKKQEKKEENTHFFKEVGIYKYSRNPAYVAFYLCFLSILLMYANLILAIFSFITLALLSIKVRRLEKYYAYKYGEEYLIYKKTVHRYIGRGKVNIKGLSLFLYICVFLWSVYYFITCVIYCGFRLSLIWIWPMLGIFSYIRIILIKRDMDKTRKLYAPKIFRTIYYTLFSVFLITFTITEIFIIGNMNTKPKENLEYALILGAGLNGSTPSNPLRQRIKKAYEYMEENENTIMIASGGQGPDEDISEAECIKNTLVSMGADPDRIILEDKSTSTEENIAFSYKIIKDESKRVGIISNGFHLCRAKLIASKEGHHNIYSVPANTLFPVGVHYCVREYFGIMVLFVFG